MRSPVAAARLAACVTAWAAIAGAPPTAAQDAVSFRTVDGGEIHADVYGEGDRAVLLAHGGRFDRTSWAAQAPAIAAAGFRVLAIDFRGRGESIGGHEWDGSDEGYVHDVRAALDWLRETGATSISLVGASFGGWAVARAATEAEPGEIDALVLIAHSPIERPEDLTGRTLFIAARDDPYADGSPRLHDIRSQFERAPEPKELVVLEGAAHAQHIFDTPQGERLLAEIVRFLASGPFPAPDVPPAVDRTWLSRASRTPSG